MRQTDGSVVCSKCGRLVDVNEEACPNCGQWRPGMFGFAGPMRAILGDLDVTRIIVYACGFIYLLSLVIDIRAAFGSGFDLFGIGQPAGRALFLLGMTAEGRPPYTLLTAIFLHGSLLHIFFNMMWTRSLGPLIEDSFGPARYFMIYILSGALGFFVSNVTIGAPTVGASGAVFGILGAAIVFGRHRGGSFGEAVQRQSWGYAIALIAIGFLWPGGGINNAAHLGGFAGGFALSQYFVRRADRHESPGEQLAAAALGLATIVAFVYSIVTNFKYVYELS